MTTQEIADQLVGLCRQGKFAEAVETLYAEDVVSVEAMDFGGMGREMRGKTSVLEKNRGWFQDNDVHRADVKGPYVSPEQFAVVIAFEWTRKATGEMVKMEEVAVYRVAEGRIVREEFLYGAMG